MRKTAKITDAELPKCVVCTEKNGKTVNAEFFMYIPVRVGKFEFQQWHPVCGAHHEERRPCAAFKLVKVKS